MEVTEAQAEELKAGKEKLMNDAQTLFQKLYEKSQAGAAGAGPEAGAGAAGNGGADDDVVDADYKEV